LSKVEDLARVQEFKIQIKMIVFKKLLVSNLKHHM
jgi:hypothetical protein